MGTLHHRFENENLIVHGLSFLGSLDSLSPCSSILICDIHPLSFALLPLHGP